MDFLFFFGVALIVFLLVYFLIIEHQKQKLENQIFELSKNTLELTPEEFMEMRNKKFGRGFHSTNFNFPGVYILHNKSKDTFYVGQGKKVLNRINSHFTGSGNGDVYADYKYGDYWTIKTISLEDSNFDSLNELERYTIMAYDAYRNGYNKTRGNM